jgi:hypothetical protein
VYRIVTVCNKDSSVCAVFKKIIQLIFSKMNLKKMRLKFDNTISLLIDKRHNENHFLDHKEYSERLEKINQYKIMLSTAVRKRCTKNYRNMHKYDIIFINGKDRLIKTMVDVT